MGDKDPAAMPGNAVRARFGKRVAREAKDLDGDDSHSCRPGFDHPRLETAPVRKGLLIKRKRWPPVRPLEGILRKA